MIRIGIGHGENRREYMTHTRKAKGTNSDPKNDDLGAVDLGTTFHFIDSLKFQIRQIKGCTWTGG